MGPKNGINKDGEFEKKTKNKKQNADDIPF